MVTTGNLDLRLFLSYRPNPTFALWILSAYSPSQVLRLPLPTISVPRMVQSYRVWTMGIYGAISASPIPRNYSGIRPTVDSELLPVIVRPNQSLVTHPVCYPLSPQSLNGRPRLNLRDRQRIVIPKCFRRSRKTFALRVHRPGRREQPVIANELKSYDRTKFRPPDPGVLEKNPPFRSELAKIELFELFGKDNTDSTRADLYCIYLVDKSADDEETATLASSVPTLGESGHLRSPHLWA